VACWETHLRLLRRIAALPSVPHRGPIHPADVAIILEDDIDLEADIRTRLVALWPSLPTR
jgi:hypothetical protein